MRTITSTFIVVGVCLALVGLASLASAEPSRAARLDVRDGGVSISVSEPERSSRVAEPRRVIPPPAAAATVVQSPAPGGPPAPAIEWTDEWFDADTYPSLKSAALNLGARWGREAARVLDQQVKTVEVHSKRNIPDGIAHEVRAGIASTLHGVAVQVAEDQCANSSTVHCVSLALNDHDEYGGRMGVRKSGHLSVQSPQYTAMARYTHKPWVDDFGGFANARPGENWLIARSPDPCLSEHEAERKSIATATEQIFPLVRDRVRSSVGRWGRTDDDRLRTLITDQLAGNRELVPDKFLQRAQRSYGSVYRQSLLVDLSRANLDHLIALSRQELVERRHGFARTLLSAGALFFVVYLLYLFVNSMTRGYFVWSLRMVAVTVVVLGVIVLLLVG